MWFITDDEVIDELTFPETPDGDWKDQLKPLVTFNVTLSIIHYLKSSDGLTTSGFES
jgi:hypothetical protein